MGKKDLILRPSYDQAASWPRDLVGLKALGLYSVPLPWQPRFFVLSAELVCLLADHLSEGSREPLSFLPKTVRDRLVASLKYLTADRWPELIVRSSAVGETVAKRGELTSRKCQATLQGLVHATSKIVQFTGELAQRRELALIIQKYVPLRRASGHLSNERRVSQRRTNWLVEFESVAGAGSPFLRTMSSLPFEPPSPDKPLFANNSTKLDDLLGRLSAWAFRPKSRIHFEWVWDSERLWIVQADEEPEIRAPTPCRELFTLARPIPVSELSILEREVDITSDTWKKLSCVRLFRECGLRTPDLWVLRDPVILKALRDNEKCLDLEADLGKLLDHPVVIRTDIQSEEAGKKYLLPRTDTVRTLQSAMRFLRRTIRSIDTKKVAFIFHRFIPAQASAFSLAVPGSTRVRIDATWGLPDGLLYYPHDSFEVRTRPTYSVRRKIRYKDEFLDVMADGSWQASTAGSPWDWQSSLTDRQIHIIASDTLIILQRLSSPAQIMWFVGPPDHLDYPPCLPWFLSKEEPPQALEVAKRTGWSSALSRLVRNQKDLDELQQMQGTSEGLRVIRLRPMPDLLRNKEFIRVRLF